MTGYERFVTYAIYAPGLGHGNVFHIGEVSCYPFILDMVKSARKHNIRPLKVTKLVYHIRDMEPGDKHYEKDKSMDYNPKMVHELEETTIIDDDDTAE